MLSVLRLITGTIENSADNLAHIDDNAAMDFDDPFPTPDFDDPLPAPHLDDEMEEDALPTPEALTAVSLSAPEASPITPLPTSEAPATIPIPITSPQENDVPIQPEDGSSAQVNSFEGNTCALHGFSTHTSFN